MCTCTLNLEKVYPFSEEHCKHLVNFILWYIMYIYLADSIDIYIYDTTLICPPCNLSNRRYITTLYNLLKWSKISVWPICQHYHLIPISPTLSPLILYAGNGAQRVITMFRTWNRIIIVYALPLFHCQFSDLSSTPSLAKNTYWLFCEFVMSFA